MTYQKGDVVALGERSMAPRLRSGVCTREELERLTVVAVKDIDTGEQVLKLRTAEGASIGWEKSRCVSLVRRAGA
jgi:hypothetical protein